MFDPMICLIRIKITANQVFEQKFLLEFLKKCLRTQTPLMVSVPAHSLRNYSTIQNAFIDQFQQYFLDQPWAK